MIVTVLLAGASAAAAGTSKNEMNRVTDAATVLACRCSTGLMPASN
jgi:hypothetical protein